MAVKCRSTQSAFRKQFCVQLKQRESMTQTIAPPSQKSLANKCRAAPVDINEIQTAVENQLMSGPYKQLARAYIEYRHDRDSQREKRGRLNQEIRGLVEQTNSALLNENANKDSKVIPTQRDLLAGIVAKHYARQHLLPHDVVMAHERGMIHYHDLDYSPFFPMFNCMLIDLKGMLTEL